MPCRARWREAVYHLPDENIRYLYNNWVPLLAKQDDRERAISGTAGRGSTAGWNRTSPRSRRPCTTALATISNRSCSVARAPTGWRALVPLLTSTDPEMRRLAAEAAMPVRDTRFGEVNRLAVPAGADVKTLSLRIENMPEAAEVVKALKPSAPPVRAASAKGDAVPVKAKLDEAFFRSYVEPILEKRGKDGYACVHCHASHTLFNGTFGTAVNVVDIRSRRQLDPAKADIDFGIRGHCRFFRARAWRRHTLAKDSPEYITILQWIKGAKE